MKPENRAKKTIRPEKRRKHGAANLSARHSAEEEDLLFAAHGRPCAGRPLAVTGEAADFSCLWELIQIVCSEERVTLTPCRARLLLGVPLGTSYKYVTEHNRPLRMQTLFALLTNDHTGLPPSLPGWTFAAHCKASEIQERMAEKGHASLFGALDQSVVDSCVFDGAIPQQPMVLLGFNGNRLSSFGSIFSRGISLRIFRELEDRRQARLVCKQWQLFIDQRWPPPVVRHILHRV